MFFLEKTIDRMIEHVKQMPGQSGCDGWCLYRTGDGNRCLLGLFIPDEMYDETWDEIGYLEVGSPLVKALETGLKREGLMPAGESLTLKDIRVLRALQMCHDKPVRDVYGWAEVDPEGALDMWRYTVIQRLDGVQYAAWFLHAWPSC